MQYMVNQLLPDANGIIKPGKGNNYPRKPITEIMSNGFFTVDRKWKVKYWNKAAERIMGVHSKDIVGKNLWKKFSSILPLDFYAVYHKAFLQDVPVHFEKYWEEMDAWFDVITYYCDNALSVSFKSSRQPAHGNYSTIPEYPAQQLKILNQLYRFVAEVTNDCLWEWDLRTKELFWIDGGHKRVFGYPIENALIPQSYWESRLHPEDKAGVLARLNKIITEGSECVWEDEYRFKKANGNYAFVHDRGHIIYDGNNKPSRMIGATQDITAKVLLENKFVRERQTKQREITEAVLTALENERTNIGRELHDNMGQVLAVAKMYIQMAQKWEMKRELYLEKSCDCIVNVMQEIRKISKALIIPGTDIIGLFDNIKNLLHDFSIMHSIKIEFTNDGIDEKNLDEKLQLNIFRIVQEQLNNIFKHAKATHATINLSMQENELVLLISDNGEGCDILKEKNGVGIINIRSRTELYNGRVMIVSNPGEGYELKVILPLKSQA
jgi:PAS domain S-box-containing protein